MAMVMTKFGRIALLKEQDISYNSVDKLSSYAQLYEFERNSAYPIEIEITTNELKTVNWLTSYIFRIVKQNKSVRLSPNTIVRRVISPRNRSKITSRTNAPKTLNPAIFTCWSKWVSILSCKSMSLNISASISEPLSKP